MHLYFAAAAQTPTLGKTSRNSEQTNHVDAIQAAIGQRLVWAAVSTHAGEEEMMVAVHDQLLNDSEPNSFARSNLLLVLIPRHPDRVLKIVGDLRNKVQSKQACTSLTHVVEQNLIDAVASVPEYFYCSTLQGWGTIREHQRFHCRHDGESCKCNC